MLYTPKEGQQVFQFSLYNRDVRSLVKNNQSHAYYEDYWAGRQIRDVVAQNEAEARKLIDLRFPMADGFVVEAIEPCRNLRP